MRIAERSRTWAADLRSKVGETDATAEPEAASSASEAMGGADDAAEEAARDEPAEGGRA